MGKPTGFMEWERNLPTKRQPNERLRDFNELYLEQGLEQIRQQGGRCMDCGVPFCHQGCPLGNLIPDWNDLIYHDQWNEAFSALAATNNFPEFTGRLCPAPCEGACTLAINRDAITIEQNEKEIIERAFKEGWVQPHRSRMPTGKKIAVVGSGPAGLAAADQLSCAGHAVTVFEASDRIGGLLRYGIPDFKLEKWVIDRRIKLMETAGVSFITGTKVGKSPTWSKLRDDYDAVLIAIGAQTPRDIDIPGRELSGIHLAMDYLTQQNRRVVGDVSNEPPIDAYGKRVVVLGGGDTGSDCLGTALRQGAKAVTQIELFPAPPASRAANNPWPQWPTIYRTSSSHEEGGKRDFGIMTKQLVGENGVLRRLQAVRVDVLPKAGGGVEIQEKADKVEMDADLLILAMGFVGPKTDTLVEQLGIELDRRGNIKTDANFATSVPNVYAAGDAKRGASLIVWAIAEGREAARAIDTSLQPENKPHLPTRGRNSHFGGR